MLPKFGFTSRLMRADGWLFRAQSRAGVPMPALSIQQSSMTFRRQQCRLGIFSGGGRRIRR